jgi:hypothetical protein
MSKKINVKGTVLLNKAKKIEAKVKIVKKVSVFAVKLYKDECD